MTPIIIVSGTKYYECYENAGNRWSNTKRGSYGKGVLNSETDKHKVERVGLLGEQAYAIYSDKAVDFTYRTGGDDYDFVIGPFEVDVKTTTMKDKAVMKFCGRGGKKIPPRSDIYIICRLIKEDTTNFVAEVDVIGWVSRSELKKLPIEPGAHGYIEKEKGWLNYEFRFNQLHPIEDLKLIQEILEGS